MRRVALVLLLVSCGGISDEERAFDQSVTDRIAEVTDCAELAAGVESRTEDLARQETDPDFGMTDYQVELMTERVRVATDRMSELGC